VTAIIFSLPSCTDMARLCLFLLVVCFAKVVSVRSDLLLKSAKKIDLVNKVS
jgi:hypothetical protein